MRQAAAQELGDEREQPEREGRQKALVPTRPIHRRMVLRNRCYFESCDAGTNVTRPGFEPPPGTLYA